MYLWSVLLHHSSFLGMRRRRKYIMGDGNFWGSKKDYVGFEYLSIEY